METFELPNFQHYGPRMLENDGRVVSNLIVQALRDIPLTVYGDGSQTVSAVSDLVEGLMRRGPRPLAQLIWEPDEYTIRAGAVPKLVNPKAEIKFEPLPQDDPRRRRPISHEQKKQLNWQPTVPYNKG